MQDTATQTIDLVGVHEISTRLLRRPGDVSMWINRRSTNGFPEPLRQLAMGGVYDMQEIYQWYANRYPADFSRLFPALAE